jgi:hypothetical protein
MRRALAIAVMAAGLLSADRLYADVELSLDVSPTAGTVDDTFVVTVTIEVPGVSGPDRYWKPSFSGFEEINSQISPTTSMQIDPVTGRRQLSSIEVRRYYLRPKRTGALAIDPARIRVGREEYETRRAFVRVNPAGAGSTAPTVTYADPTAGGNIGVPGFDPPAASRRDEDMFLHVVADKREAFVGEQVTVTWLLYTRTEVLKFEPRPPRLDGLWSEKLYEPDAYFRYHEDVVGGVPYEVAIVSKRAVFPTQAGEITIGPFTAEVSNLYTPLGESDSLKSKPLTIRARELPGGAPAGFDPTYVGVFSAEAEVDRNVLDAGESMTLTLEVRGAGAIRRTTPPSLSIDGFEFRAPRDFEEDVDTSGDQVRGERTYRYWTTPQRGGAQEIPAIAIPYFDPRTGEYQVATTRPIRLMVKGNPGEMATAGSSRENVIGRDIRLIRDGSSIDSRAVPRMYRSHWYWIAAGLPLFGFLGFLIADRVREGMRKETPRARLRRARGKARQRLRVAEIHLRGNRPAKFFGELARVIQEHIDERVGKPVSSMTRDQLRAFLAEQGFAETTIGRIDEELEHCDFARFAPSASGPGEMRAAMRRTRDLLREIEKTRTPTQAEGAA